MSTNQNGPLRLKHRLVNKAVVEIAEKLGLRSLYPRLRRRYFRQVAYKQAYSDELLSDIEYIVFYGDGKAESHFRLWDPVFASDNTPYVSLFSQAKPWWPEHDQGNILATTSMAEIDPLLQRMPNLKVIFYPANNGKNIQFVRKNEYTHVFIGHGDSNKASSAHKALRIYDEIWVAGQAHIDRFDVIPGDYSGIAFHKVGQPWMKDWMNQLQTYEQHECTSWGYFPTWKGYFRETNYSSLEAFEDIATVVKNICGNELTGHAKLHPWTSSTDCKSVDETIKKQPKTASGPQAESHAFNISVPEKDSQLRDILEKPLRFLICDISGALTECLYINRPIFLYKPSEVTSISENFHEQHEFCYIFENSAELEVLLKTVIVDGNDYLASKRVEALSYTVDIKHTQSGRFYEEVERVCQEGK